MALEWPHVAMDKQLCSTLCCLSLAASRSLRPSGACAVGSSLTSPVLDGFDVLGAWKDAASAMMATLRLAANATKPPRRQPGQLPRSPSAERHVVLSSLMMCNLWQLEQRLSRYDESVVNLCDKSNYRSTTFFMYTTLNPLQAAKTAIYVYIYLYIIIYIYIPFTLKEPYHVLIETVGRDTACFCSQDWHLAGCRHLHAGICATATAPAPLGTQGCAEFVAYVRG